MYSVNWWGSHPDAGNEDCWVGMDFASYEEALDCYEATPGDKYCQTEDVQYIELVRETGIINNIKAVERINLRSNPFFRADRDTPDDWEELECYME